jgi:hypothetical protein
MDKAGGDDIPKMAVIQGTWDVIEVSLAKLGLGTVNQPGKRIIVDGDHRHFFPARFYFAKRGDGRFLFFRVAHFGSLDSR